MDLVIFTDALRSTRWLLAQLVAPVVLPALVAGFVAGMIEAAIRSLFADVGHRSVDLKSTL